MAAIYSTAFWSTVLTADTPTVEVTVPDGEVWVLRSVDVFNGDVLLPVNVRLYALADGTTFWVALASPPPIAQSFHWRGRQVAEAGAGFGMIRDSGESWGVRASGYRLVA